MPVFPVATASVTTTNWIERTKGYLLSGQAEERNRLDAPYAQGGATLTLRYDPKGAIPQTYVAVGLNVFYVWGVDAPGKKLTVQGGAMGAWDAAANVGDVVYVRPRFTPWEILQALNEELAALASPAIGLYQVKTADLTFNAAVRGYDFPHDDVLSVYSVNYSVPGPEKAWPRVQPGDWRLTRGAFTTDFPSGMSLRLYNGFPGRDVRVVYKAAFTPLPVDRTNAAVADTGLPASAWDIPPIGAAVRLVAGREIRRNFTEAQPDTRRAAEVPPGSIAGSVRNLLLLRQQRVAEESAKLKALYPPRRA